MGEEFLHIAQVEDEDGVVWEARQLVGHGTSVGHSEIMSGVTFRNSQTGEELRGQVIGIDEAPDEELKASLKEAKRLNRLQSPDGG